jgi:2-alkyl-3-oxoalkanoate reductase
MFGNGQTTYHPLYIDNLVDAFELAAQQEFAIGGTYLIGMSIITH